METGTGCVLRKGEGESERETKRESCRASVELLLEVLDDAFELIRLYHGHSQ